MLRLQTSTNATWANLPVRELFDRPVRIAVVDTGASIESSVLDDLYDGRLIECRSWTCGDPGRLVKDATADAVGHGTHATSLALKITENTDCEIYVAQVFDQTHQRKSMSGKGSEAMAKAIALVGHQTNISVLSLTLLRQLSMRCSIGKSTSYRSPSAPIKLSTS